MLSPDLQPAAQANSRPAPTRRNGFFNPYVQIAISIVLSAAAQLFMKKGADDAIHDEWLGFAGLHSMWVWCGIAAMIAGLFSWLHALRFVPLNIAFSLACLSHALVPLSCWLLLGEIIPARRWCGIVLVIAGVFVVARPLVHLEEKL